jgi:hypothetical protein
MRRTLNISEFILGYIAVSMYIELDIMGHDEHHVSQSIYLVLL